MQRVLLCIILMLTPVMASGQDKPFIITTVDREPFSMMQDGGYTGFSIDLWNLVAEELGRGTNFRNADSFAEMLKQVEEGSVDGAIANISITAEREAIMDFTQPIFDSGLQIMLPMDSGTTSVMGALLTWDIGIAILIAIAMLFGGGMLMWTFERHKQAYFDRDLKDAPFPAFWWALNLVVNGGFEERMPMSRPGRVLSVIMVVASLFLVSVFVAKITAAMTVDALQSNVSSLSDLDGRRVGTIEGSTAASFLEQRDIQHVTFAGLSEVVTAFEDETLDAVFFDGPILSYYATTRGAGKARMVQRVFKPENYGMALPTGSDLVEPINRALLRIREDGRYSDLRRKWFGASN